MAANKHKIALITDSTCNIPAGLVEQYGIIVVPAHIVWGTDDLRDQIDITTKDFYERLGTTAAHPTTSQPVSAEVSRAIADARQNGAAEAVICVISSGLSGTVNSAQQAASESDIPIHVYDSLSVAMGLGWQVLAAARAREAGGDAQAMLKAANDVRQNVAMMLVVGTLEYLHKGGRIGGAQALVGMALDVKPRLIVNPKTGKVEVGDRTRTRSKAIEAMYTAFFESLDTHKPLHVSVQHASAPDDCRKLLERIKADYKPVELMEAELTPVLGAHAGPGTIGIAGYSEL